MSGTSFDLRGGQPLAARAARAAKNSMLNSERKLESTIVIP